MRRLGAGPGAAQWQRGAGNGIQQTPRVLLLRVAEDVVHRALLDDAALLHHAHEVGGDPHHGEVVRDEQIRQTQIALQVGEQIEDLVLNQHVEGRDRLVQHDDVGLERQGACDRDALPLSAGQLVRVPPGELTRQRHLLEQIEGAPVLLFARADAVHVQRLGDQAADAAQRVEGTVRVLEDRLHAPTQLEHVRARHRAGRVAVDEDLAVRRLLQLQQHLRHGRLTGARFADESERLAARNRERHRVDGAEVLMAQAASADRIVLDEIAHLDHRSTRRGRFVRRMRP